MCKHLLKIQRLILALLIFGGGIFYTSSATARVCFLPDSTDCGEGDVDVPEVQITCATYGGYETEAACLEARTNKTAQTCTLNSGCYYPKCAYDSERKCKNENPDKNCLSQDVDGVKCWYSQLKTCFDQGYKSACSSDENSTPVNIEAFDGPCYKCTEKATCKQMKPGVYYGPNDTCPKYTDRKDAGVSARDGKCSTCEPQACSAINTAYKSEAKKDTCGSDKEAKKVEGTDSAADGPCYTCEDKPVEKNCSDINKDYKNKDQVYQCNIGSAPVFGVSGSDGQCYRCIKMIDQCLPRDYKIYYVVYPDYLQGDTAIHSGCSCFAYLVKGISSNTDPLNPGDPIKINAISTPGGNSSSTEKIKLPAILTDVSSSNPYSVKIQENSCYGSEHCSAQAVKFDVFEAYAPETAKRLKEDDDFTITGGITFSEAGYYYTGRQLKPKSQSINSCDDYVVILGNGNPKACAQISSDYYNYQEACPKGYEKKRLPNVYDSTGAQCYTCEKATPVITITYKETYHSLTPGADADPDEYYYKTLKFTSTSSDNVSRTIQMKTYPSKTCKTQYTTGQPVTIEENSETVIASLCGTKSAALPVSSVAALDTFINGTKVYSFEPYYSSNILYDGLDGKTVETNDYTVKFVKEKTCTPTCTSETGCKYGSKTQRDGCGGTCTVCYPPCAIGYWYGSLAQENCYIKPATYIKQPSNPNCSKCVCDNGKPDANGHYLQCQYF